MTELQEQKNATNNKPLIPFFDTLENMDVGLNGVSGLPEAHPKEYRYAWQFLYSYRGSEPTFNSYRREIERLLQWSWLVAKKNLQELRRDDIEKFIEFCQRPPLSWVGTKNVARFIEREGERKPNPEWRPFVTVGKDPKNYFLSQKALQAIFAIIGSFFAYLLQEEYIEVNPVAQIRQKSKFLRKQQGQQTIRRLSELQWSYVVETAELLAKQNPKAYERTLFIMNALYGMYLRISELAASARWVPQMGHFFRDTYGNWWFKTVGKGNKERNITVSDAMLNALKRYRTYLGLTPLPAAGESLPLLTKQNSNAAITSTRQIRNIVQFCFDASGQRLRDDGFTEEAQQLAAATVHWLRHTGISEDVKHRPREHVRDDAGHGSSAITDKYIDVELRERHASGKTKRIKPD